MTEETHNAATSRPIGIITAIGVSAILGCFLILSLLFSIQDYGTTVASSTDQLVMQIFLDTIGKKGMIVLMVSNDSWESWYERGTDDGFG
jgi:amino acid transporter